MTINKVKQSGITYALARFASELSFSDLPEAVMMQAKRCVLDTLGAILAGYAMRNGKIDSLRNILDGGDRCGRSTVMGFGTKTSCERAAFMNGTMAEMSELVDGHEETGGHPGGVVLPAVLAIAEDEDCNGKDVLSSVVVGYETYIRIASEVYSSTLSRGFITTGTCGPFGAASACAKMLNLGEEDIANALGIAGFHAPITLSETFFDEIKPTHAGQAAQVGLFASLLARIGFTASHSILEGSSLQNGFCRVLAGKCNPANVIANIGNEYRIMGVYFKPYASCRFTHSSTDAILELVRQHKIDWKDVESIVAKVSQKAKNVVNRHTTVDSNYVCCQHSLPYVIAVSLIDREVGVKQFSRARIKDATVHELARKVKVLHNPKFKSSHLNSHYYSSELRITTTKGKYEKVVNTPRGDPQNRLTDRELINKFMTFASLVLEPSNAQKVVNTVMRLEKIRDITELTRLLHP